jgi:hypothetical protein
MDAVGALVLCFDHACSHAWESLASATSDLTEEEAGWPPPAYVREEPDAGVGVPGTILWHLNHLEHCHRHYAAVLRARPVKEQPDTAPPGALGLDAVRAALAAATAVLRAEIAKLGPEDLSAPCTESADTVSFVAMSTRHLTWHAAQIRQTRRLFARHGPAG